MATRKVPRIVRSPAVKNPRLIGAIAVRSLGVARTMKTPAIDARTPMALATTGNTRPRAGLAPIESKAATPRMIDATRVTS